jgi:hypothetical protein
MKRCARTFSFGVVVCGFAWLGRSAEAAGPTTADCLVASDASLRSESEHQLRAERSQLLVCAASSCPADIRRECIGRVEEVNAAIPTMIFEAKDADGNDVSAVRVTMDGEELTQRLEGLALPVDPGTHSFTFEAPGQPVIHRQFIVREGQKDRREPVAFAATRPLPATQAPGAVQAPAATFVPADGQGGVSAQAVVGIVVVGVGVVGLGAGTVFGVLARSKRDDAQKVCPGQCADQSGVSMWADAKTTGNLSTAAYIAGGAAVLLGSVLWLTAGHGSGAHTQVGVGIGGVDVRGQW